MANKETVKQEENTVTIDGNELKESELTEAKVFCKSNSRSKSQKDAITRQMDRIQLLLILLKLH